MAPPIIKRFLISFDQHKWLAFLAFLASLGVSSIIAFQPPPPPAPPSFRALGQLNYQTPPPTFTATGSELQAQGRGISKSMLTSARVMESVARKLHLSPEQIQAIREKKLRILFPGEYDQPQKKGEPAPNQPQVITLEYTDTVRAEHSTLVLETLMNAMIDYSRWFNNSQLRSRIEALQKRLALVKVDLTTAEEKFFRYISKEGTDVLSVQDGSLFNAITTSQQRRRDLIISLREIDGQINSLVNQLGLSPKQAYSSLALSADPILASIRSNLLNIDLALQSRTLELKPDHPEMIRLKKQKQVNDLLLRRRAQELIGAQGLTLASGNLSQQSSLDPNRQQLATQLLVLQTQQEGLRRQLETVVNNEQQLKIQYEKSPDKQLQQAKLVQAVEFQRIVYQNILTALVDAQSAEVETVGSLTTAIPATYFPPLKTTIGRPNKLLILLAGAAAGLGAGAGLIFLLTLLDDRLHSPQELRDALSDREVPLLGQLPLISLGDETKNFPVLLDSETPFLSFYERFRSNIRSLGTESSRVVIVTSIAHEEGKSLSAYNLAIAAALAGKRTLLIEADLRSPSHAQYLDVPLDPAAAIEPLRYYAARSESVSLVPGITNLYVLPSPGPQRQAAAIIESDEMRVVIKDARGRFDMVIIDTPSLSQCNDALLLEPFTDGIILITRPGLTRSNLLSEAIDQLIEKELTVIGAAINGVPDLTSAVVSLNPQLVDFEVNATESSVAVNSEAKI
jgi:Mrp family chromosome partitioning ATPase